MYRLQSGIRQDQEGLTGLSTAIILIAFVIVASFAYVILSAGLFSSQKAKEAINNGIQSTMATVEIRGNIIAYMVDSEVTDIFFCVGIPAAGSPVDFTPPSGNGTQKVVVSYSDAENYLPSVNWTVERLSWGNDDYLLDPNELFQMTIFLPTSGNVSIGPYDSFSLEIKPPDGPVLTVDRTIPSRVSQYVNLH
jgi:flagellin FlaB